MEFDKKEIESQSRIKSLLDKLTLKVQNMRDEKHKKTSVSKTNFDIIKLLGSGQFGRVYLVEKNDGADEGQVYAMKVLAKSHIMTSEQLLIHTLCERKILEQIKDLPFLATIRYAFQTPDKLYLILDFVQGGELFTQLKNEGTFSVDKTRFYIAQIILALEQLHKLNISYRDIKLENIMLDADGNIVLVDFGLAKILVDDERTNSYCGTLDYMAPEIVCPGVEGYDRMVDWWSLGVLMVEILQGRSPFTRVTEEEEDHSIVHDRILYDPPDISSNFDETTKDLILKLLEKDPSKRIGFENDAEDLKKHPFFETIDWDKIKNKLCPPPKKPILCHKYDVSEFCTEFTDELPENFDLPEEIPKAKNIDKIFRGFSYFPSDEKPVIEDLYNLQSLCSPFFSKYEIDFNMPTFGQGASSICLPCIEKSTGNQYAVKILTSTYDASNEIETLEKCKSHKNIVKMIEFMKDSLHQYIVLEVLNGEELYDRIKNNGNFDEVSAKHVFKQVTQTVKFLHSHGIVHGDLKPENIILTYNSKESQVKIIDFGFSCQLNSEVQIPRFTLEYAAPESLLPGLINESRDIWSLGVILYIMLCGMSPFRDYDFSFVYQKKEERIIERIREGRFNTLNENWNILSDNAKDLITRMLCVEVKLRPSIDEILFHEWFENTETENESNDHQANDVLDGNVVEECFETLTTEDEGVHSIENTDISCSVEDQKTEKLSCETVDTTTENQAETSSKNVKLMKRRFTTFLGFDQNDNFLNFPNFKNWRDILERESTKEPASSQSSGVDTLYETFEATHSSTVEFVIPSNKNNTISGKALTTSKTLITKRKFETQENSNSQSYKRVKYSTREFYENNEAGKYFLRNVTTVEYCMKKPLNSSSNTKAASTIKPLKFNKETAKLRNGKYLRKSKAPINYSDTKKRNMTSK